MRGNLSKWLAGVEPRLVLVGGFLAAGKTSLIGKVVKELMAAGVECGVVTNDQARGLVDTQVMEAVGMGAVAEVAGGCFCCRLEDLVGVLTEKWSGAEGYKRDARAPVVFAEPVGSCTDLMSTVILPLQRVYKVPFKVSPLSVVVDGRRALASLGGRRIPGSFSKDVGYIYRKQLEEAEVIVINKADVMEAKDLADLVMRIEAEFPGKETCVVSAKTGQGVDDWLEKIFASDAEPQRLMEVDYERYGVGEALLGWCNAEIEVVMQAGVDGDEWLIGLAKRISERLEMAGAEVAHFKMALKGSCGRLGITNETMSGLGPEVSKSFEGELSAGTLTVNLRAEYDPDELRMIVEDELANWCERTGATNRPEEVAAFRPGQPVPTARVAVL